MFGVQYSASTGKVFGFNSAGAGKCLGFIPSEKVLGFNWAGAEKGLGFTSDRKDLGFNILMPLESFGVQFGWR